MPKTVPTPPPKQSVFRLSEITTRLRDILLPATEKKFWVRAQFIPDRTRRTGGHCYGHLVETNQRGQDVAKLRTMIWKRDLDRIEAKLPNSQSDENPLRHGGEICALCSVRFHEIYGLSLTVFDVDPDFGASHLEKKRRAILDALQKDGILEQNHQHVISIVPLKIGLVTASQSAAHKDFEQTLNRSGFAFQIFHEGAVMQGAESAASIVEALQTLSEEEPDLVCIVRGGGAPGDLAWLDDESIARAVATYNLPVWVGIGHEIDHGVLDVVAHRSFKTPTAVAESLVSRLREAHDRLVLSKSRLADSCRRREELAVRNVSLKENGLRQGVRKQLLIQEERFARRLGQLKTLLAEETARREGKFQTAMTTLRQRTRSLLDEQDQKLLQAEKYVQRNTLESVARQDQTLRQRQVGLKQGSRKLQELMSERLQNRSERLRLIVAIQSQQQESKLKNYISRLNTATTNQRLQQEQRLTWKLRSLRNVEQILTRVERELQNKSKRFQLNVFETRINQASIQLTDKQKRLNSMNPERLFERGYAILRDSEGEIIRNIGMTSIGERITAEMLDGVLTTEIKSIEEKTDE